MRRSRVPRTTSWEWGWLLDGEGDMSASESLLSNTDTNMKRGIVESQQQLNQLPVGITLGDEIPPSQNTQVAFRKRVFRCSERSPDSAVPGWESATKFLPKRLVPTTRLPTCYLPDRCRMTIVY